MKKEIRVLLADDSATMRRALIGLLSPDPRLEIVGSAQDGEEVVGLARLLKPDVISMDVQMPRLDGLAATRRIMAGSPCRIVLVSSHDADAELDLSFNAVQAGAVEIFGKPRAEKDLAAWGRELADLLVRVGEMPLAQPSTPSSPSRTRPDMGRSQVEILGLAASTGGPPALALILKGVPGQLPIPLLITQHITEGFTGGFRRWLGKDCALPVEIAREGESPLPGRVYLAPDGCHLEVEKGKFRTPATTGGFCPSGDRLFSSLARSYGAKAAGVVLTGMGEDGGRGLLELHRAGGIALAQEPGSCVVDGMPRFAREIGAAQRSMSPEEIGSFLKGLCGAGMGTPK